MSPKKILSYVLLAVSVFFLFKLYDEGARRSVSSVAEAPPEQAEIATPDFPVDYSLGTFDSRFGISQERFLQIVDEAIKVWEDAAARELFQLSRDGPMKINLIFDWRQERLLEAKGAKAKIDENGKSFDQLQDEYDERARSVDQFRLTYEETAQAYKSHLSDYNSRVARWNEGGEHTEAEQRYLQNRKKELEDEQGALDKKVNELNSKGEELNKLGERMKASSQKFNLDVENFNGTYVRSRDFEKGVYDGKAINIYEFEKEDDLKLTLVHEFGHVLGLGHLENPKAIMNRKLAVQDVTNIHLTTDDLNLLKAKIK
jgi:predicted Zn-dependent protease